MICGDFRYLEIDERLWKREGNILRRRKLWNFCRRRDDNYKSLLVVNVYNLQVENDSFLSNKSYTSRDAALVIHITFIYFFFYMEF